MNLCLLQIADSALPISGYTHSWGLEAAISQRKVHDPETLENWTRNWLRLSLGPLEGMLVAAAFRSARAHSYEDFRPLNRLATVSIVPPSIRRASQEMGDQLIGLGLTWSWCSESLRRVVIALPNLECWHHSIAFGLLGALAHADVEQVLTAYLHQATLGMIGAGVRAIPVGHTHGQQLLAYLQDDIRRLVPILLARDPETAGTGCPQYEVLCDEQTRLYARMFRS